MRLSPLSISYERLFPHICDLSDFRWPEPIKTDPTRKDQNIRCSYHKDHEHITEQCKSLHYLVEKLIKAKHLEKYVRITNGQSETTPKAIVQALTSPATLIVVINYIHGSPIDNKHSSRRQRRKLLCATSIREQMNSIQRTFAEGSVHPVDDIIIFPPIDVNWVLQPHEDALILTLGVGGFDVRRILVDLGSSVDLLKMSTYRQISHSPFALENLRRLLSGFNKVTTTSLGDVVLLLQADPVTMSVQFSMVDDLSPYNAIMGCAWLHKMKTIPFTYHQMVSYLTEAGQVDLLGNQLVVQQYYQMELESRHPVGEKAHPEPSNVRKL